MSVTIDGYRFKDIGLQPASKLLMPILARYFQEEQATRSQPLRLFDLGCGNGAAANHIHGLGYDVTGVDPSLDGIRLANEHFPHLALYSGSAYDDLSGKFGNFDAVYSIEVVEHLYDPVTFANSVFDLLRPGGLALISTPYHGYTKNLFLAATGKLDKHFTALWPHGHIKFWSIRTLSTLLRNAGFEIVTSYRVGRVPILAKSMLIVGRRPTDETSARAAVRSSSTIP